MSFDSNEYWIERGRKYASERDYTIEWFKKEEDMLCNAVARFSPRSIIEIGCGFGRLTERLVDRFPNARIVAIDLSPHQIVRARIKLPSVEFRCGDIFDPVMWKGATSQVCVSAEFTLHMDANRMRRLASIALLHADVFIHDFNPNPSFEGKMGVHVVDHDYVKLYESLHFWYNVEKTEEHGVMTVHR